MSHSTAPGRARRVEPVGPGGEPVDADYADAFSLTAPGPDDRTPEQLARAALEGAPAPVRAAIVLLQRHVLRLDLGDPRDPATVLGWTVAGSTPDLLVLRAESPLMSGQMQVIRTADLTRELVTSLRFHRRTGRLAWAVIGPVHRLAAPRLMEWSLRTTR